MNSLEIFQIILFTTGTLFLIFISYRSLRNPKSHGFYRFFVFEFALILILLNIPYWFTNPLSILQIISWLALIISIIYLIESVYLLRTIGGRRERKIHPSNYKFENTGNLVKDGIYKYVRHPMYGSLLFLCSGTFLKNISVYTIILTVISFSFLVLTAKMEEKENISFFGADYKEYIKETKMFVPLIF